MNETDLLKMAKNPKKIFSNTDKVLAFLSQLPSSDDRMKYWKAFNIFWQKLTFKTQDIIFSFSLFDASKTAYLCNFFSQKIRIFLSHCRSPLDLEDLEKVCVQFPIEGAVPDYKNMYRSFIMKIITTAPDMISDAYALSKCFTAFTTEEEFQTIIHTLSNSTMARLFANRYEKLNGTILLEFFNIMRDVNRKTPFQFDLNNAFLVVIKLVIPLLRLNERIDRLCETQFAYSCSCGAFFSKKNPSDEKTCKKLSEIDDRMKSGKLPFFDGCCEKIKILHEFMKNNQGAQFLALVNKHFCVKFFNEVCNVVSVANAYHSHHLPTLILGA